MPALTKLHLSCSANCSSQVKELAQVPISTQMDKKVGCIYAVEIHLGIKQDTMSFSGNCKLEFTELEKNKPDSEK
jgi:hypothetical protein